MTQISGSISPVSGSVQENLDVIYFPFATPEEIGIGDNKDNLIIG